MSYTKFYESDKAYYFCERKTGDSTRTIWSIDKDTLTIMKECTETAIAPDDQALTFGTEVMHSSF